MLLALGRTLTDLLTFEDNSPQRNHCKFRERSEVADRVYNEVGLAIR